MKHWTPHDEAELASLCAKGIDYGRVAAVMDRSRNSIIGKARKMNLSNGVSPGRAPADLGKWTPEKIEQARALFMAGGSPKAIAVELGLTYSTVNCRANRERWVDARPAENKPRIGRPPSGSPKPKPRPTNGPRRYSSLTGLELAAALREPTRINATAFAPLDGTTPVLLCGRPSRTCAWPVGGEGAETMACGVILSAPGSYCAHHHARAVRPVELPQPAEVRSRERR